MNTESSKEAIEAWKQLHRARKLLLEKVEKYLKSNGLPPLSWYDVLLELQRAKDSGLRQYQLSEKVLLNKHNLSRLLDRLEKKDLVERQLCSEDGRGNRIHITTKGETVRKEMWPFYSQALYANFGSRLNPGEFTELSRLLDKVLTISDNT